MIDIFRKKRGDWDISYNGLSIRNDPGGFTFVLKSDSGYQPYASTEVDALLEKALVERDRKVRLKLYEQVQDNVYKDIPMIKHGDIFGFDTVNESIQGFAPFYTTPRFWNVWKSQPKAR
jgi:peptide/nickel transport system substrate-binding protein